MPVMLIKWLPNSIIVWRKITLNAGKFQTVLNKLELLWFKSCAYYLLWIINMMKIFDLKSIDKFHKYNIKICIVTLDIITFGST